MDASDINSGHTVTAIYGISFVGSEKLRWMNMNCAIGTKAWSQKGKIAVLLMNMLL
jgi:hypothetical protein